MLNLWKVFVFTYQGTIDFGHVGAVKPNNLKDLKIKLDKNEKPNDTDSYSISISVKDWNMLTIFCNVVNVCKIHISCTILNPTSVSIYHVR